MTALQNLACSNARPHLAATPARELYQALMRQPGEDTLEAARLYLGDRLDEAAQLPGGLPADLDQLEQWVADNAARVAEQYAGYLKARHAGAPRRFFSNRSHALFFLRAVAPTKLVDGAWLYSTLSHWADGRYHGLIRTYLEELGDGEPAQNHVVLYRKLIADLECEQQGDLDDSYYVQGAIQLALGALGQDLLPEVIGFNLGYEQLPLHLLITSFELNELGIDPYYFTLHVTIDNASTGHAHRAAQSLRELLPASGQAAFIERVRAGYQLNELGTGTQATIAAFDLDEELVAMFERKQTFAQHMHSDYCKIEGRTVNQWLAEPGGIRPFLSALERKGWIKRKADPAESRFWQLIDGPGAAMFGVFSAYEKQLLADWIADGFVPEAGQRRGSTNPFRSKFREHPLATSLAQAGGPSVEERAEVQAAIGHAGPTPRLQRLLPFLAPQCHATPAGLYATRLYARELAGEPGISR
ncbi:iron-containing redox enzyme family protein [Pseudomonas sp. RIT-PI-S]|uniref:iron-containing redox enzyme family protein n=1 Tax=Pseudomonas sp. RIT-PI-S TaxID=3035295 RepID=UPI0021DA8FF4|nr:iron-containing redox enzyme family protein [Pseudomonas sp. RIT-PI-S]